VGGAQFPGPQCQRGKKLDGKRIFSTKHLMRSAPFWDITQRIVVIPSRCFGITGLSYLLRSNHLDSRIFEDGTDRLFRNIDKELPLYAA